MVDNKSRNGSSWKRKRKRKDMDIAECTRYRKKKKKTLMAVYPSRNFVGPADKGEEHVLCEAAGFQMKSMPCCVNLLKFLHSSAARKFLVVMNLSFKHSIDHPAFFNSFGSGCDSFLSDSVSV